MILGSEDNGCRFVGPRKRKDKMKCLQKIKKATAVVLAVMMLVAGTISGATTAASVVVRNPDATMLENGAVLSKTAKPVEGEVNAWDVTLKIESPEMMTTSDTVIVIDISDSMDRDSRLVRAKEAAIALARELLPDGNVANRVALVAFSDVVRVDLDFTSDFSVVENKINKLRTDGGTFTQGAIHTAANVLGGI